MKPCLITTKLRKAKVLDARFPFSIGNFCSIFHFNINQTFSALKLIEQEGHIKIEDEPNCKSKAVMSVTKEELYHINTTDQEDAVLNALRTYSGLFCDGYTLTRW